MGKLLIDARTVTAERVEHLAHWAMREARRGGDYEVVIHSVPTALVGAVEDAVRRAGAQLAPNGGA